MNSAESSMPAGNLRTHLQARFRAPLMSFFRRRVRDQAEVEDLTQEVLLRVVQALYREPVANPESYVFKIAANLLKDRWRRSARTGVTEFIPLDVVLSGEVASLVEDLSPERILAGRDLLDEVLRTLNELEERTRNIFILFRLEKMKQREIAALYGISASTVEKHMMKAVLHLTAKYGSRWQL